MHQKKERIHPEPRPREDGEEVSLDVWGFADSGFALNERGCVEMRGRRYALGGQELPELFPWIFDTFEIELDATDVNPPSYPPEVPEPRSNPDFRAELSDILDADAVCEDSLQRLRHGHGHTQEEMYALKYGGIDRVPDLVVYPSDHDQVVALVRAAERHRVSLIPYGGGTNVTCALRCISDEARLIVSVDMQRMNRVLWIDPVNCMAHIQAGAVGRHIVDELAEHGFTIGHEPDSIEFSTLGGWIATHASGMKKNKYGNIEDLVLDLQAVTASGELSRTTVGPRESVGTDLRRWLLGSEGNLGIITSAVVKIFALPEVQHYGSVIFPSFEQGVEFMYELTRSGQIPASVRLVDNLQFQLSMALKPRSTGLRALKSRLEKLYVTGLRGFDPDQMVACTLVYEGSKAEVQAQEANLYRIARRHGGLKAGGANGERGEWRAGLPAHLRDRLCARLHHEPLHPGRVLRNLGELGRRPGAVHPSETAGSGGTREAQAAGTALHHLPRHPGL
jgi:alkyldihydroxyacetonephosphate synthase